MKFYKSVDLSKIKVLSFDLDNTIYDCQTVIDIAEDWFSKYLCKRYDLGKEFSDYDFWAKIKSDCVKEEPNLANDVTLLRARSLVVAFEKIGKPLANGFDEALELMKIFIKKRSDGYVCQEVHSLLADLKQKYPMVAVSNGNLDPNYLGVASYFEYDIRPNIKNLKRKPYTDMFEECAKLKHVKIDEVLHIGDDPYTDIYGAALAGCPSVWLYKGYTGISPDEKMLKHLPNIEISNILELRSLLLK